MVYLILLLIEFIICLFVNRIKDREFVFDPVNITIAMFLISLICYMCEFEKWGFPFNVITFISVFMFILFIEIFHLQIIKADFFKRKTGYRKIRFNNLMLCAIDFVVLLCVFLYGCEIAKVGSHYGLSFRQSISFVKENYSQVSYDFNALIRQSYKIVIGAGYVSSFYLANALIDKPKKTTLLLLFIPILSAIIINIISGSRTDILNEIFVFTLSFYFFWKQTIHRNLNLKHVFFAVALIAILFGVVFYFSVSVIKPKNTIGNDFTFLDYLNFYFGGTYQSLNLKITNGISLYKSPYFGYHFFEDIYSLLNVRDPFIVGPEFIYYSVDQHYAGNVGTILLNFFYDFGIIGGLIIVLSVYLVYEITFNKTLSRPQKCYSFSRLLFFVFLQPFAFSSYSETFSKFFGATFWLTLLCTWILWGVYRQAIVLENDCLLWV